MFQRLLIANRGEIACRVMRTARRLGVAAIAVYSDADEKALHVDLADEAWPLGPAPARESYLSIDKIVETAQRAGAQAVHPGYGFLAENADFAERCAQAGLVFVGPPARAMRIMGSKASAKMLMERAGAPVVPGYHGDAADISTFSDAAERIGYPLLVKASAGGGGRGMRVVERASGLASAIESAAREAQSSFGDARLLLEKYLARPRHIEVQIFADAHGGVVSFLERDCSLQRRHQKILEETPAPGLTGIMRRALRECAVAAAKAAGYIGAGTVEFLVQDDAFYFLEMNARLQVEHPITEMISNLDLVEWQLRVACNEKLPLSQDALDMSGCAMEARICAEDPARGFLPSTGEIAHLRLPRESSEIRVDTGVRPGDRITEHYDSLLAKLVVRGETRQGAIQKLASALDAFELVGVASNLDFLRAVAACPAFSAGGYDTGFVERHGDELTESPPLSDSDAGFILAAGAALCFANARETAARGAGEAWSPWAMTDGWRIDGRAGCEMKAEFNGRVVEALIVPLSASAFRLETQASHFLVDARQEGERVQLRVDGVKREIAILRRGDNLVATLGGRNHRLRFIDPLEPPQQSASADPQLTAPLPARVTRVLAEAGDTVQKGAPLVVLEAMKMEITVSAPRAGVIETICFGVGDMTPEGATLVTFAEDAAS